MREDEKMSTKEEEVILRKVAPAKVVLGIDFDNTIVSYDALIHALAVQRSLISPHFPRQKEKIKDQIRQMKREEEWQEIQAIIYGDKIHEAVLMDGVSSFLEKCSQQSIPVQIISHKTEYSNLLKSGVNFRAAALHWMEQQQLFTRFSLSTNQVHFTPTRGEKIQKIQQLGCTHFIDDLEEIFHEEGFPKRVIKILYAPGESRSGASHNLTAADGSIIRLKDWGEIYDYFFG